jgi:hypothetical protein
VDGYFGAIGSGYLADKLGKRITLEIGCIVSTSAVFLQVFAQYLGVLLTGKVNRSDLRQTEIAMGMLSAAQLSGVVFVIG